MASRTTFSQHTFTLRCTPTTQQTTLLAITSHEEISHRRQWGCVVLLLDDQIIAHLRDSANAGGDPAGAVLDLGVVDEAAELDDALVGLDIDLRDVQVLVAQELATDLVADDLVVDVLAGAFACAGARARRHRPGEKTAKNKVEK